MSKRAPLRQRIVSGHSTHTSFGLLYRSCSQNRQCDHNRCKHWLPGCCTCPESESCFVFLGRFGRLGCCGLCGVCVRGGVHEEGDLLATLALHLSLCLFCSWTTKKKTLSSCISFSLHVSLGCISSSSIFRSSC